MVCEAGPKSSSSLQRMANVVCFSNSISTLTKVVSPRLHSQIKQSPENKELDMARGYCLLPVPDTQKTSAPELYHMETTVGQSSNHAAYQIVEQFNNVVCSVCQNRRPKFELLKEFTYAELHEATHGFSPKNYLSEGGFGSVYKGKLQGLKIAVKQHKYASPQGEKEFKAEVNALSKAIHENVVMLLGSCSEGNNRLLVYEFVCNGSLDQHLSRKRKMNLEIAIAMNKNLLY